MASLIHVGLCVVAVVLCVTVGTEGREPLINVENETVCQGTSYGMETRGDSKFRYAQYKEMYTSCTFLLGNLEIVFLDTPNTNFDLEFLSTIKQVTGYVLIVGVHANYVPLSSLQIIRGETLFHYPRNNQNYSLFIAMNYDRNSEIGLKELRFTSLKEILAGKVFFMNNNQLCFENNVNWYDINPTEKPPVHFKFNSADKRRDCGVSGYECHPSCLSNTTNERHCWGAGPDMCQKLTQGNACHPFCDHRCYGKLLNQCCHHECAAGCSGPLKTDCLACRHFLDDGSCVPFCPPSMIYDNRRRVNIPNPSAKYAYGGICVKKCPGDLFQDHGYCVSKCPEGKHPKDGKNCEPCEDPCPKICNGTGISHLSALTLSSFVGCTSVDGNLKIAMASFYGDKYYNIPPLHPSNLTVLRHVREIRGYLLIQSDHPDFTSLSFLSSLEVIKGRELESGQVLHILGTPLRSLELMSLREISRGNVYIVANPELCYSNTIDWGHIFSTSGQKASIAFNKPEDKCRELGEVCDPECSSAGCWGQGAQQCLQCLNYEVEEDHLCLINCSMQPLLYDSGNKTCKRCHPECAGSCTGPENSQCARCAHVAFHLRNGLAVCWSKCPHRTYPDHHNVCSTCHLYCQEYGCTGPSSEVGPGGCNRCSVSKFFNNIKTCLPQDADSCEPGFYMTLDPDIDYGPENKPKMCVACHDHCLTCKGPGSRYCEECQYFRGLDGYCTDFCPQYAFGDSRLKQCLHCDNECRGGCSGPLSTDCNACSNFKIFLNENLTRFNCTVKCPPSRPYQVRDRTLQQDSHTLCADDSHPDVVIISNKDKAEREKIILGVSIVSGVLLLGILGALTGLWIMRRTASMNQRALDSNNMHPVCQLNLLEETA